MSALVANDRCFDPAAGRISSYFCQLFILIGDNYIRYCLLDNEKNTFIALAAYDVPSSSLNPLNLYSQLDLAFSEDETLGRKYPSVIVGIDTPWHSLAPSSLFNEDQINELLGFNFRGIPPDARSGYDTIGEEKAVNFFAFKPGLGDILKKYFPGAALVHCTTGMVKSCSLRHRADPSGPIAFLNIRGSQAELACFEKGRPLYFNSFDLRGKEDILYFTLYALGQLNILASEVTVVVSGEIDRGGETHHLLEAYLDKLEFSGRPASFDYSPFLSQLPTHRHHDLFSLALCGS